MTTPPVAAALLLAGLAAAFAVDPQEKGPASAGRTGVLNLRDCMDKGRNAWMADIEADLQKQQESDAGRATDLNPQERQRIRTKYQEATYRKRFEVYSEIVRLSGILAQERGLDTVQRIDRMPSPEPGDTDLMVLIDHRTIVYSDPAVDLTSALLERLNRDYAARRKK